MLDLTEPGAIPAALALLYGNCSLIETDFMSNYFCLFNILRFTFTIAIINIIIIIIFIITMSIYFVQIEINLIFFSFSKTKNSLLF